MGISEYSSLIMERRNLNQQVATEFKIEPDAGERGILASQLRLLGLRKVRFEGQLIPEVSGDWRLTATIGATVVQPCSVTLEPVTTRIQEDVERWYQADFRVPDDSEVEMNPDDTVEPLPSQFDLGALMAEVLALALPDFPRAAGAELGQLAVSAPGVTPLTDEAVRPFAELEALRNKMVGKD